MDGDAVSDRSPLATRMFCDDPDAGGSPTVMEQEAACCSLRSSTPPATAWRATASPWCAPTVASPCRCTAPDPRATLPPHRTHRTAPTAPHPPHRTHRTARPTPPPASATPRPCTPGPDRECHASRVPRPIRVPAAHPSATGTIPVGLTPDPTRELPLGWRQLAQAGATCTNVSLKHAPLAERVAGGRRQRVDAPDRRRGGAATRPCSSPRRPDGCRVHLERHLIWPSSLNTRTVCPATRPRAAASSGCSSTAGDGLWNSPNIELISFDDAGEMSVSGRRVDGNGTYRGTPCTGSTSCARPPVGNVSTNCSACPRPARAARVGDRRRLRRRRSSRSPYAAPAPGRPRRSSGSRPTRSMTARTGCTMYEP